MHLFFIQLNMKKFKTKRKKNIKKEFIVFLMLVFFLVIFVWLSLKTLHSTKRDLIMFLLDKTMMVKEDDTSTFKSLFNLDHLLPNCSFNEVKQVMYNNYEEIYIYNTHDTEKYKDNKSVYDASIALQNNLQRLGITSKVEEDKVSNYSNTGLKYYDISRKFINDIKEHNPNIKYYIDIHRDSVEDTKVKINDKSYAKVLFVLGTDNENYEKNKEVIDEMNNYLDINYKGLSKGILSKSGEGVNGVYNQDIDKNVLLIEIGGVSNTFEEVQNTTELLSLMFFSLLRK